MGVDGDLGEAGAFAPDERVGLIAEQSLPHSTWRNPQQVAAPQSPHTLLLRPVDHAEHLQQQLETWRDGARRKSSSKPLTLYTGSWEGGGGSARVMVKLKLEIHGENYKNRSIFS